MSGVNFNDTTTKASTSSGGITGPGSSTDNAIVRWDGTGGTAVQNSTEVTISDANNMQIGTGFSGIDDTTAKLRFEATNSENVRAMFLLQRHAGKNSIAMTNASSTFSDSSQLVGVRRAATSAYSFYTAYSDADAGGEDLEFRLRGDGEAYADGLWNSLGADYAEYFESEDGNEIAPGTFVSLSDDNIGKIRATKSDDDHCIGVISTSPAVCGNNHWSHWKGKYKKNEFGGFKYNEREVVKWMTSYVSWGKGDEHKSYIEFMVPEDVTIPDDAVRVMDLVIFYIEEIPEGVTVPDDAIHEMAKFKILSDSFDPSAIYVPTEEREEKVKVGLVGQLCVRTGEDITSKYVMWGDNGCAMNSAEKTKFRVMEVIRQKSDDSESTGYGVIRIMLGVY